MELLDIQCALFCQFIKCFKILIQMNLLKWNNVFTLTFTNAVSSQRFTVYNNNNNWCSRLSNSCVSFILYVWLSGNRMSMALRFLNSKFIVNWFEYFRPMSPISCGQVIHLVVWGVCFALNHLGLFRPTDRCTLRWFFLCVYCVWICWNLRIIEVRALCQWCPHWEKLS